VYHTGICDATVRLSSGMWRVLYRTFDLIANPRYAGRQTGRCALRAVERRQSLSAVWASWTTGGMCFAATISGDVWNDERGSVHIPDNTGTCNAARM